MSVVISLDTTAAVRAAAVTCQRRKVLCGSRGKGRTAGLQHLLQQPLFTLQRNLLHYLQSVCLGQYPTNLCSPAVPLLTHAANLGFKPWPEAALCSLFLERPICPCQVDRKTSEHSCKTEKQPMELWLLLLRESRVKHNSISLQGKEPIIWQLCAAYFSGRLIT